MVLTGKKNVLVRILFFLYLLILLWAILWKFGVPTIGDGGEGIINLIPFNYNTDAEMRFNFLIFIPFGFYLATITSRLSFGTFVRNLFIFPLSSFVLEAVQYALAIGRSDITDLILNALGGAAGLLVSYVLLKLAGRNADKISMICGIVITLLLLAMVAFFLIYVRML